MRRRLLLAVISTVIFLAALSTAIRTAFPGKNSGERAAVWINEGVAATNWSEVGHHAGTIVGEGIVIAIRLIWHLPLS